MFPDGIDVTIDATHGVVYEGIIEEAGRDHLIIRDNTNNLWYLIRIIYLNYVEFMEPIIYSHSFSEKTY